MKKLLLITLIALAVPAVNLNAVSWTFRQAVEHAQKCNPNAVQLREIQENLNLVTNALGRVDEEIAQAVINETLNIDELSPSQQVQQAEQERREREEREEQARREREEQEWQANTIINVLVLEMRRALENQEASLDLARQMQEEEENEHASLERANQLLGDDDDEQASLALARQLQNEENEL